MTRGSRPSVSRASGDVWTVRGLLLVALGTGAVALLLVGLIGALSVQASTQTVESLSRELGPAQASNAAFIQSMLDAETELRAYLISGDRAQLADHRAALAVIPGAEARLATYAREHPEMSRLVTRQQDAASAWIREFARPAVADGSGAVDRTLFERGVRLFDAVKRVNAVIGERLQAQVSAARSSTQDRLDRTVGLMAAIGVLGAIASGLIGWRVTRSTRESLAELELVVERLAAGAYEARAPLTGPAEIRRLGAAINEMAGENARAREVAHEVQAQLLEIDRVKSEFVSNVSHELRTPLTSISGYLELLTEDLRGEVDPAHGEMMSVMQRNVARLRSLIEDLLDLGRLENQPERLEVVDLARVLRDVAEELRLAASSRSVVLRVEVSPASVPVHGDPAQLQRAVTNLVSNAVKFSYDGGEVLLRLTTDDHRAEVSVSDRGIGIPAGEQAQVGERFFRASNAVTAHVPGTGLGLRMVQTIMSNHRGTFRLSSREGGGTTATLQVPLMADPGPAEQTDTPQR